MRSGLADELIALSPAEKRELAEALIASAESEASVAVLTEIQRAELRARLAQHRANPGEVGITFQDLKARLRAHAT
ncbi:MAG TPA: addiction module protein [Burkholderiaceae bacterium]